MAYAGWTALAVCRRGDAMRYAFAAAGAVGGRKPPTGTGMSCSEVRRALAALAVGGSEWRAELADLAVGCRGARWAAELTVAV